MWRPAVVCLTILMRAGLASGGSPIDQSESSAISTQAGIFAPPTLSIDNPAMADVVTVYQDAVKNLMKTNTVWHQGDHVIRAGANYPRPWTRDGSLNSMMAGSLLEPAVAESTLWHVTDDRRSVAGQWWDRMLWVIAAEHHYLVTGDQRFLREAYRCAKTSLENQRREYYVPEYGLFRGPSHLCDGIAGYPDPPAVNTDGGSSYCEDYPHLVYVMTTSIQAIYYGAYQTAARMGQTLTTNEAEIEQWESFAADLKIKTNQHLWVPKLHRYGYFVHGKGPRAGQLETHQEGAGLTYALLFGLADDGQARQIMAHFHKQPHGMTAVWPHFARFNDDRPGRHNVLVWPQMNAYWALATLRRGRPDIFNWEFGNLTRLFHTTSPNIREIYDSILGTPHGGYQSGKLWNATHNQTWGATGYLGLVYSGLFGMRFTKEGIQFQPCLPENWGTCRLNGLTYRNAILNVTLTGCGRDVIRFQLDGKPQRSPFVAANLVGTHDIVIHLQKGSP